MPTMHGPVGNLHQGVGLTRWSRYRIWPIIMNIENPNKEHTVLPTTNEVAHEVNHDDVNKWKHFPRSCPFVRGIHRSPVNSPQKGQWRGALMVSLICAWISGWVSNREAGDLWRHCAHYNVTVMQWWEDMDESWNTCWETRCGIHYFRVSQKFDSL